MMRGEWVGCFLLLISPSLFSPTVAHSHSPTHSITHAHCHSPPLTPLSGRVPGHPQPPIATLTITLPLTHPPPPPQVASLAIHSHPVADVAVTGDGALVASVACNEEDMQGESHVAVWSVAAGRFRGYLGTMSGASLACVTADRGGRVFAAGGVDGRLYLWEVRVGSSSCSSSVGDGDSGRGCLI